MARAIPPSDWPRISSHVFRASVTSTVSRPAACNVTVPACSHVRRGVAIQTSASGDSPGVSPSGASFFLVAFSRSVAIGAESAAQRHCGNDSSPLCECCTDLEPATDRLRSSKISEVVVTNTLPIPPEKQLDKITVLSIAPLLARAIREVFDDGSVTTLFGGLS